MAEYGNPDTEDWEKFLYKYSPYQNIDNNQESYPPILVTTSTRDDRVHPGHARKFVKKLWDMGEGKDWPVYYYENIEYVLEVGSADQWQNIPNQVPCSFCAGAAMEVQPTPSRVVS